MAERKKTLPLGKRLLRLRRDRKLTLKHVANETGLTPEHLSKIEKGEVIPPVAVVLQLSKAIGIDSSVLLREEKRRAEESSDRDYQRRTEAYSYRTLTPEARHRHLKAFKVFIDPLSDHEGVSYRHAGEEFIYVLTGKIEVKVGENENILGPGESIHFNSSVVHKLRNLSGEKAELLVVLYTP